MKSILLTKIKGFVTLLVILLLFGSGIKGVFAQISESVLYVPLIGITSVPEPLSLPKGPGNVKYRYAVKSFLEEVPLSNVQVADDKCNSVKFTEGDENNNSLLDSSETWRYECATKLSFTTSSVATATATANNLTATDNAYATVVVGLNNPAPLVSIVNVTKVAYPLAVPAGGSRITYSYKVNNPGIVPLGNVIVTDDKCAPMSGKLGDTNGNQLLDINEVWIYSCSTVINQTTTDTATVSASANGLQASDSDSLTVLVDASASQSPNLLDVGITPGAGAVNTNIKIIIWGFLSGILAALFVFLIFLRKRRLR